MISVLRHDSMSAYFVPATFGLVPFTLAILAVPVFDTLRVMSTRILKGGSPFQPDKTHLHHLLIELGCSHAAATLIILLMNISVVAVWWIAYLLGASVDVQLYAVVAWSLLVTFGFYHFMQWHIRHDTRLLHFVHRMGYYTHISRTRGFMWLQKQMDKI